MNRLYYDVIRNFILGGISVSITSLIGTYMNPLLAAIFWSFPFTIIPVLFFMREQNKSNLYLSKYLISTTFSVILLMIVSLAMAYFIKHSSEKQSLFIPIFKSSFVFGFFAFIYYYGVIFMGFKNYFM